MDYAKFFPLLALLVVAGGFGCAVVFLSSVLGPKRPSKVKNMPYECGIDPVGDARLRFSVKFYVEAIFLFPWAVMFQQLKLFGLIEMFAFLGFLLVGYIYLWRRGALEWD
jgi:NADH-quinone oxidoreductase subunit A